MPTKRRKTKHTVKLRDGQRVTKAKDPEGAVQAALDVGINLPAEVLDLHAVTMALHTVRRPDAAAEVAEAEAALAAHIEGQALRDMRAVIEGAFGLVADVTLDDEQEAKLAEDLAIAERKRVAIDAATKRVRSELGTVLGGQKTEEALAKAWAEALAWEPADSTPWGEVQAQKAAAASLAPTLTRLYVDYCVSTKSATPEERKLLRQRFKTLPPTMPTLKAVRTELRKGIEEAKLEAEQRQEEADKVRERMAQDAALAARARQGKSV